MKKGLVVGAAIALVVWAVSWFRTADAVATSGAQAWPGGMGALGAVADRFPPLQANEASVKLTALANALPKNQAVDNFVAREISRGELTIGGAPALPEGSAIRKLASRGANGRGRRSGIWGGTAASAPRAV